MPSKKIAPPKTIAIVLIAAGLAILAALVNRWAPAVRVRSDLALAVIVVAELVLFAVLVVTARQSNP
jgi:fatty acid desaturase